jgi:signal transduction histidine kinase
MRLGRWITRKTLVPQILSQRSRFLSNRSRNAWRFRREAGRGNPAAGKQEAEAANAAKDRFAALSHELRTPLTPVIVTSAL